LPFYYVRLSHILLNTVLLCVTVLRVILLYFVRELTVVLSKNIIQIMSDVEIIIEIFCQRFVKCCPRSKTKGNILRTESKKKFNDR